VSARQQLRVVAVLAGRRRSALFDAVRALVFEGCRNHRHAPVDFGCIAAQSFSGLKRHIDVNHAERRERVDSTALATAGVEPIVPASPIPLTPSGFTVVGVNGVIELRSAGTCSRAGSR